VTDTTAGETAEGDVDPDAALAELAGQVLSTGPQGEEAAPAEEIELTEEELEQIRGMNATAAIVFHYSGDDWSRAQRNGLETQFAEMGIEVLAVTDANFDAAQQTSDIENMLTRNPDIIVSIPTDPSATSGAFQAAADQGVTLVFMDNVPNNMEPGEDYVSVVSADNYGNGVAAAHLMARELGGEGQVGIVYHEADFFVTAQRYEAFKDTIAQYPNIEVVEEQGIGGPDFAGQAEAQASAMLLRNPNLNGIWAVWDVPAEGVIAAARDAGASDLVVTTIDLGANVAINMAEGGVIRGIGAQRPFDQGVTEAMLAGYGLLDKEAPPYVALPPLVVDENNVLDAWQEVYRTDPPESLSEAAGG
jgi:ribose transport system substrate-binding protein